MKPVATTDIGGKMILLGTGTSVGVPSIGCGCDVCTSSNSRNVRTRCSVVFGLEQGNLLIDTPPDLRHQLLREKIGIIHSVLFTHEHADHISPFACRNRTYEDTKIHISIEPNIPQAPAIWPTRRRLKFGD